MTLLLSRPGRRNSLQGINKRFMIRPYTKPPTLQQETEVSHRKIRSEELPVECRIPLLGWRELAGEEGERPPSALLELL
jgi:hypothetical protein